MCILKRARPDRRSGTPHDFEREAAILALLRHPHVIELWKACYGPNGELHSLLMQDGGSNLYDLVTESSPRRLPKADSFDRDMCSAVAYLHERGVYHRDLKLDNMTVDVHSVLRIIDFGLAAVGTGDNLRHPVGTKEYMAPELVSGCAYCGKAADAWSLGICLFAMHYMSFPFKCASEENSTFQKVTALQEKVGGVGTTALIIMETFDTVPEAFSCDHLHRRIDALLCADPRHRCSPARSLDMAVSQSRTTSE